MAGYKAYLEKQWERMISQLRSGKLPQPFSFEDFNETVQKLEELKTQARALTPAIDPQIMRRDYLNEIWLSEIPPPVSSNISTIELVAYVISGEEQKFRERLKEMAGEYKADPDEWWPTMSNLWQAMILSFDNPAPLTEDRLKLFHVTVMKDLVEQPGNYRTRDVTAAASSVMYLPHGKVSERVPVLLNFAEEKFQNLPTPSLMWPLALGALFFSEYLLIHPFIDGNGRTARLVLSILLRGFTLVPVSLYYEGNRDLYLQMLEKRGSGGKLPWSVVDYLSKCAEETSNKAYCVSL